MGLPLAVEGKLYNCAAVLQRGQLLGIVPKTNLPNYGEFYEAPSIHRLRRGLPGYLILFAPHAFVPQRQLPVSYTHLIKRTAEPTPRAESACRRLRRFLRAVCVRRAAAKRIGIVMARPVLPMEPSGPVGVGIKLFSPIPVSYTHLRKRICRRRISGRQKIFPLSAVRNGGRKNLLGC